MAIMYGYIDGYVWLCRVMYGYVGLCRVILGYVWLCRAMERAI